MGWKDIVAILDEYDGKAQQLKAHLCMRWLRGWLEAKVEVPISNSRSTNP